MTTYKVYLRDIDSNIVARFHGGGRGNTGGGLQRILYRRRIRYPDNLTIEIAGSDERISLFEIDGQLEILRNDPAWIVGGSPRGWVRDCEGFHRQPKYIQNESGDLIFRSNCAGYDTLLASETTHWPAGTAYTRKHGPAETVAKAYVEENIGPSAGLDEAGASRVRKWLTVEATGGTGATWTGQRSEENLLDVVHELAEYGPGDFKIVNTNGVENPSGPAAFQFQWRDERWGKDKTRGNPGGLPPVVFAARGAGTNIKSLDFSEPFVSDINVVYGLGWGIGEARTKRVVSSAFSTLTPWSRRAVSRDARDLSDYTELEARIQEQLDNYRARTSLSFFALQTPSTRYLRDWDLGDLVTFELLAGVEYSLKIVAVEVVAEETGEEIIQVFLEQE